MTKPKLLLIGSGGHAHACIDVIEMQGQYQIGGLVGLPGEMGIKHLGYSVIAVDSDLPELAKLYQYALISVGQIRSPSVRMRLYQRSVDLGFQFPVVVAPSAHVSRHATIGSGTIVMHGAIVNAGSRVGDNCIINTRALVEHDATVEDHCHISTGAILNGDVRIGAGSYIGSGSVVKEGVLLGKACLVGMGVSVRHNQADHARFVGDDKS
jgi:sugar O-acyltransferase (sialic acid O-acetyltransferase NeuD family)